MVHSGADWEPIRKSTVFPAAIDLAELAARNGSIVTHDRRGDLVWFDGFEDGLPKWEVRDVAAADAADISTVFARNGAQSCRLLGSPAGNDTATIRHIQSLPPSSGYGIEMSFMINAIFQSLSVVGSIFDGTNQTNLNVIIDPPNTRIQVINELSAAVDVITGTPLTVTDTFFHTLKVVVDIANSRYHRLILDGTQVDLTAIDMFTVGNGTLPRLLLDLALVGGQAGSGIAFVDDVIITQNEPL